MPKVWKTEKTVYYTRILKYANKMGNYESACSRKEVWWNARLSNGKVVAGLATKKAAMAAVKEDK